MDESKCDVGIRESLNLQEFRIATGFRGPGDPLNFGIAKVRTVGDFLQSPRTHPENFKNRSVYEQSSGRSRGYWTCTEGRVGFFGAP